MFLKKSSSHSAIKNIVTLNAYSGKFYQLKDDKFQPLKKLTFNKSNFISSYIGNKDLITTSVSLSRSIPEEDIADILEIKAYEELGLDQASDFVISYVESKHSGEERKFDIFVAEPDVLDFLYVPIKEETKYIDLIVPAPLLYKTLYRKEILEDNGTHCFVYFTKKDAIVTIYSNGEYLYSKSIDFSLESIYEKYCELMGEQVDAKEFFEVLGQEGLKTTKENFQQNFMKIFGEAFITINDIIIYAKRAFELEKIDQMFIGTVDGPVIGLDDYSQHYLGIDSSEFNFNYNINCDEWYTDQLQSLMLLSTLDYMEDESRLANLTRYIRPPSFVNRASGQFIISTFAAISLGLAYPLFYLVASYANDATTYALKIQNDKASKEADKYKKILGAKKKEILQLDNKIAKLSETYQAKTKTLTSIYDKKVNYRLKSGIFHTFADALTKKDVNVEMIESENDTLWLSLVSSNDRKLTELIKYISDKYFSDINQIDIELIEQDPESNYYKGILKVELR